MGSKKIFNILEFMFIIECLSVHSTLGVGVAAPPSYSKDLETSLRTELFQDYSVLQRPDEQVHVVVSLTLLTINEMNIKDQTLSISGYLTLVWSDSRLSWDNASTTTQDYSSVTFLFSTEQYVWRPAIIIENSVNDISVISDKEIPMRIASDGTITWSPSGIYKVSCDSDTTYYPMDSQICFIKVSTWSYTASETKLGFDQTTPLELSFYSTNGEWHLVSAVGTDSTDRARKGQTFSSLTFQISLQRRPMFHVLNTLFPVALMAFLIPLVFKLPPDSGEKVGYSLTVLLAYAVYLTLISDNIPSTSVTICVLSIYLALTLMYGTLSVIFVIFVLMANHKPEEEEVPSWLKFFLTKLVMPLVCWKGRNCFKECNCGGRKDSSAKSIPKNRVVEYTEKPKLTDEDENEEKEEEKGEDLSWKIVSTVLDKFFFFVLMLLVCSTTFIVFAILVIYYATEAS